MQKYILQKAVSLVRNFKFDLSRDYYEILNVSRNATEQEIKVAYHNLARVYHPDLNYGVETKYFKDITNAYQILSNADLKMNYDSTHKPKPPKSHNYQSESKEKKTESHKASGTHKTNESHTHKTNESNKSNWRYQEFYEICKERVIIYYESNVLLVLGPLILCVICFALLARPKKPPAEKWYNKPDDDT